MKGIKDKLIEEIRAFTNFALLTDSLFEQNFGIDIPPIKALKSKRLIPPEGILEYCGKEVKYTFHGLGCRFVFDSDTIVDFNYKAPDWKYEGFTFFKFWEFVRSRIPEFEDKELLKNILKELEDNGIIENIGHPNLIYKLQE